MKKCGDCIHSADEKTTYFDIHEICFAGHCMLCVMSKKINCIDYQEKDKNKDAL